MSYRKVYQSDNVEYRAEAADRLRELFPKGSEVTTSVKHVTRSGMGRVIAVYGIEPATGDDPAHITNASYDVARVVGWRYDNERRGVYVEGAGMDMAFHVVYTLAHELYAADGDARKAGYLLRNRTI